MSSASTQRLTALGTLCRRPSALLVPLAPFVLLILIALVLVSRVGAAHARRLTIPAAALPGELDTEADVEAPVVTPTRFSRGFAAVRPNARQTFVGAVAMFVGVLLAASAAATTFAFLNSSASIPASTISSGSLALTVQSGSTAAAATTAIPTTTWTNMLPGDFAGQQITVASTGSAKSNLTARIDALTAWDIRVIAGTCPTTLSTATALTTTAASIGSLAGGTSAVYCVQATLPTGAAAGVNGTSDAFTIYIDATQVPTS